MRLLGEDARCRLVKLTALLCRGGVVTNAYIRKTFGVSRATAARDLKVLETYLPVSVTDVLVQPAPVPLIRRELRMEDSRV